VLALAVRKGYVVTVTESEGAYFASIAKSQALTEQINSIQRQLPDLQNAVRAASNTLAIAQSNLRCAIEKMESARAERDKLLGKNNHKVLTGSEQRCLTE
jgi:uncharacterized protein YlxW (UPF0749 family)